MAFIKFTEHGKSFAPKISISPRGLVGFSQGACKRYRIDRYSYCVLYYDPDSKRIAFELGNNAEMEGAIKIRHRKIGADVGAKSFLTYFNILPTETMNYTPIGEEPMGTALGSSLRMNLPSELITSSIMNSTQVLLIELENGKGGEQDVFA